MAGGLAGAAAGARRPASPRNARCRAPVLRHALCRRIDNHSRGGKWHDHLPLRVGGHLIGLLFAEPALAGSRQVPGGKRPASRAPPCSPWCWRTFSATPQTTPTACLAATTQLEPRTMTLLTRNEVLGEETGQTTMADGDGDGHGW